MASLQIKPFTAEFIPAVAAFCDQQIGRGYFSIEKIEQICQASQKGGKTCSLLGLNEREELAGVRLSYPPNQWLPLSQETAISPSQWSVSQDEVAYFQSLFVDAQYQGMGLGSQLSRKSIEILEGFGAKAILCHSWKESPGNSSFKYLQKMGFVAIAEHSLFWNQLDYFCTGCQKDRCLCTATEMILYL